MHPRSRRLAGIVIVSMNDHERPQDCLDAETVTYGDDDFEFTGHWSMDYVELHGECVVSGRERKRIYTFSDVEEGSGLTVSTNPDGGYCVREADRS